MHNKGSDIKGGIVKVLVSVASIVVILFCSWFVYNDYKSQVSHNYDSCVREIYIEGKNGRPKDSEILRQICHKFSSAVVFKKDFKAVGMNFKWNPVYMRYEIRD